MCKNSTGMKTSSIFGIVLLAILWIWLAWAILASNGITLYNLIIVAISGIIVFVPLYRKFSTNKKKDSDKRI